MPFDEKKLAALQARGGAQRTGGKGTPRRKIVSKPAAFDTKKLQQQLLKAEVTPLTGLSEVNLIHDDGHVLSFKHPVTQGSEKADTYAIYGRAEKKDIAQMLPDILNQLGPDNMDLLRRMAEDFQKNGMTPDLESGIENLQVEDAAEEATPTIEEVN